jgi:hypothetical protein
VGAPQARPSNVQPVTTPSRSWKRVVQRIGTVGAMIGMLTMGAPVVGAE